MTICDDFEREGLADWEAGRPVDGHTATCPDCLAQRLAYERLGRELSREPAIELPGGWEDRVFQALGATRPKDSFFQRVRRGWWAPLGGGLTVAATILVLLVLRPVRHASELRGALEWAVIPTEERRWRRGEGSGDASEGGEHTAAVGDRLKLWVEDIDPHLVEVRVLRDGEVILRCPSPSGSPGCRTAGRRLDVEVPLRVGRYEAQVRYPGGRINQTPAIQVGR